MATLFGPQTSSGTRQESNNCNLETLWTPSWTSRCAIRTSGSQFCSTHKAWHVSQCVGMPAQTCVESPLCFHLSNYFLQRSKSQKVRVRYIRVRCPRSPAIVPSFPDPPCFALTNAGVRTKKNCLTVVNGSSCANVAVLVVKECISRRTTHFWRSPTSHLATHPAHHHNTPQHPGHRISALQAAPYTTTPLSSSKDTMRSFRVSKFRTD